MIEQHVASIPTDQAAGLSVPPACDTVAQDMARYKVSLRIQELGGAVGILNPYELSKRTGMPYESCRLIWSEQTRRIDLSTIEKLCEVFGVIPGQLFRYEILPDETQDEPKSRRKS